MSSVHSFLCGRWETRLFKNSPVEIPKWMSSSVDPNNTFCLSWINLTHLLFPSSKDTEEINGVQVPIMLLGDPAYPLHSWLLKRYTDTGTLTDEQRYFKRRSRARMTVECAFGQLKGQWRCQGKRLDVDISTVLVIISVCCTVHNACEKHGEAYEESDWAVFQDERGAEVGATLDVQLTRVKEALTELFYSQRWNTKDHCSSLSETDLYASIRGLWFVLCTIKLPRLLVQWQQL